MFFMETPIVNSYIVCGFRVHMSVGIQTDVLLISTAVKLNHLNFVVTPVDDITVTLFVKWLAPVSYND